MMRLLKYDWKRNASSVLGLMTILLIVQILITSAGYMRGWEFGVMLALSMLAYGVVSTILIVMVCRTFDQNIKVYNRRLLPVRSIWSIVSSLIQSWISMLILMVLVILHMTILWKIEGLEYVVRWSSFVALDYVVAAVAGIWKFTFVMLVIFLSITVARAIGKKGSLWIGILFFFAIQTAIEWLEFKIFTFDNGWVGQAFSFSVEQGGMATINNEFIEIPLGPHVFEMLLAAGFIYAMVYLIDRKVEA
ncbi:hypothetical protein SAMN05661091_0447 [Paenibacillus uliginis N3/975]|uniref:ABC-2 type transport system permease protein n=1 Tax=Paenibacillus uliginis N3/975 TaxID=1313296 RepID=A0A1X7GFE6_9BACL|nr:hypothetical protein [Paenibacillus uliginis]SMF68460.1 hypothetical protein SAMN05661091_0447 [Paenibacillus uliginis N3/975]